MINTYLLVKVNNPYHAYKVGGLEYCQKESLAKKYLKGYYIRKAIDNSDGCYIIVYKGGLCVSIGYQRFKKSLAEISMEGKQIQFVGTERDWLVMQHQDVCIQDSIRGFGRDISQKQSKELYRITL